MTSYEGTHPTVLVRVGNLQAQIDEQLAPAIQAIWECGIDTFTCCQDLAESNADWPVKLPHMAEWVESPAAVGCLSTSRWTADSPSFQPSQMPDRETRSTCG